MTTHRVLVPKTSFTWVPKSNEYVAEISDLPAFKPIDGITLTAGDGHEHPFEYDRTERDAEGEAVAWVFKPATPGTPSWTRVRIFND